MSSENEPKDDENLFRREMEGVRPLKSDRRVAHDPPRPEPRPRQRESDEKRVLEELLLEPEREAGLETGEELQYLRPGYQKRFLNRLRRGQFAIEDHFDLHHMNEATARNALLEFIAYAVDEGFGCVRVVHGKGLRSKTYPKLKAMTNRLLRRHPAVIAFVSCRPVDGGTGAVAVLLKTRK